MNSIQQEKFFLRRILKKDDFLDYHQDKNLDPTRCELIRELICELGG